jgi:hypothetical protein
MKTLTFDARTKYYFAAAAFTLTIVFLIRGSFMISSSAPYRVAVEFIKSDSAIYHEIGSVMKLGFPTGDLNSPEGQSYFKVKVTGEKKAVKIGITVEQKSGIWQVVAWEYL